MTDPKDKWLDDIFAEAGQVQPKVDENLMARVLADAQTVQSEFAEGPVPTPMRWGLWSRFMDMIGGWPAASGLVAATLAGVWVGVAPPATVDAFTASVLGEEISVSLMSEIEVFDAGFFVDG